MKKRAAYKVFGIITTILVISVLGIALLGNIGQGQETLSSDPVFIVWGKSVDSWGGQVSEVGSGTGFDHEIITIPRGTSIVVLNSWSHSEIKIRGLISVTLGSGGHTEFTPDDHGIIYTPDVKGMHTCVVIFVT